MYDNDDCCDDGPFYDASMTRNGRFSSTKNQTTNNVTVVVPEQKPADAAKYSDDTMALAKSRIVHSMVSGENSFQVSYACFSNDMLQRKVNLYAEYVLNGEKFQIEESVSKVIAEDSRAVLKLIFDHVAAKLSSQLVSAAMSEREGARAIGL